MRASTHQGACPGFAVVIPKSGTVASVVATGMIVGRSPRPAEAAIGYGVQTRAQRLAIDHR